MTITPKKLLLLPFVLLLGLELLMQLGALIIAATDRDTASGWSTENTRVLTLGDSNTFGIFLDEEESYPSQLETIWNERHPENPIEVINLGYPGTNSLSVVSSIDDIINTFHPDVVLLTIGANDLFNAGKFIDGNPESTNETSLWNPLALIRRYSRLYTMVHIFNQGLAVSDDATNTDTDNPTEPEKTTVKKREVLKWSDDVDQRVQNTLEFKAANREALGDSTDQTETIKYGDKKIAITSAEQNWGLPITDKSVIASGQAHGYQYIHSNLAIIERKVADSGAELYLMNYAASDGFYGSANNVIRSSASKISGVKFIDIAAEFLRDCPVSAKCTNLFFPDLHPNETGYKIVAMTVADRLEKDATISKQQNQSESDTAPNK